MIELYEKGSIAETQDSVCIDLARQIKDRFFDTNLNELLTTSITEKVPPNPLQADEHDLTLSYWLQPFTTYPGFNESGTQLMTMVHGEPFISLDILALEIVRVPVDKEEEPRLPQRFDEWQVLFRIENYVGVLKPDRTKPSEEEVTICRIMLADALTIFTESETMQSTVTK